MNAGTWAKPACARRLVTCGAIAAVHAILLVSYTPRKPAVLATSPERNRTIFLAAPRPAPLVIERAGPRKPSQSLPKKTLQATDLPGQHVAADEAGDSDENTAPDDVAAKANVLAIEHTADVDPNWTTGQSVKSPPITDIKAYSLSLAGKADAASRQGKLAALAPVDTPFKRMQSRMAQAARVGGNSTTTAISSSGEPITILTRNGKRRCYVKVSTSVAPSAVFDNRGSGRSTEVQCPKEVP